MACNNYQTYPSCRGCSHSCQPSWRPWNNDPMYFPDFVAHSCCNPCCSGQVAGVSEGCNVCNGGGCGGGWRPWNPGCGSHTCGCCRCCGGCSGNGGNGGCGDDLFGCPTPIEPRF